MSEREPPDVGAQLKALREQRGLSMRGLARMCSLSPNAISLIERGVSSPSVSTLHRLAMALQVPITSFFEEPGREPEIIVSRAGERPYTGNIRVMLENLGSGLEGQTLEPFVVTLNPGAGSGGPPMVHGGHELVYCLEGEIEYEVSGQAIRLAAGDSVLFEARLEHRWRNAGTDPTRFLLVFQSTFQGESVEEHLST